MWPLPCVPDARDGVWSKRRVENRAGIGLCWEELIAGEYKCWQLRGNDCVKMQVRETKKYPENLPYEFLLLCAAWVKLVSNLTWIFYSKPLQKTLIFLCSLVWESGKAFPVAKLWVWFYQPDKLLVIIRAFFILHLHGAYFIVKLVAVEAALPTEIHFPVGKSEFLTACARTGCWVGPKVHLGTRDHI